MLYLIATCVCLLVCTVFFSVPSLSEYLNTSSSIPASTLNEICTRSSMAPLHKAVEKGQSQKQTVISFKHHGLNVSLASHLMYSTLVWLKHVCHSSIPLFCFILGWPEVVSKLLALHADTTVTCALYNNDTPLKLAERFQMHDITNILKQAN